MIMHKPYTYITRFLAGQTATLLLLTTFSFAALGSDQHRYDDQVTKQDEEHQQSDPLDHEAGQEVHPEDVVKLSAHEIEEFGIQLSVAGPGTLRKQESVPGEVVANADRLAHIYPRFPGVVKSVRKGIGDEVKAGDVLAVIESNESLEKYDVKSLIGGTVIDKHLTVGEVHSEERPAFVIADLDTVWVNLSIYQTHLQHVQRDQEVLISVGNGIPDRRGRISYVSPILDPHTRTATARVVLANKDGKLRPGLFVNATITTDQREAAILVPKSALQHFEGSTVVFVSTQDGFEPRPVDIGDQDHSFVEILDGLSVGDEYVNRNAFTLKAELTKSGFGHGHAH
jgi:cobalt-zinc-cadmium efflux system membrane fusion protein